MKTILKFYLIWLIPCVSYFLGEILLAYEQSDLDQLAKTRKCIGCDFRDADFSMGNLLNPILGISELLGSEQRRENFLGALLEGADLLKTDLQRVDVSQSDFRGLNFVVQI